MKRLLKWLLGLILLAIVLVALLFFARDSILRLYVQHNVRSQTGLDVEIGKFHLGFYPPVVDIKNLRIKNPPAFGGTPFVDIPEIHAEFDLEALQRKEIHITLLRFNLGELDVVKSSDGQTNLMSFGLQLPDQKEAAKSGNPSLEEFKKRTHLEFKGIDCLNFSVGEFKYLDLQNQSNNVQQKIGIENCQITNVTSAADLVGIGLFVGLRSGDFFKPLVAPDSSGSSGSSPKDWLKMLGQ